MWVRSKSGRLTKSSNTTMTGSSVDVEAFKAEMLAANRLMIKEAMEEIARMVKGK